MKRKIELLAPAGNYESLVAAVENGADAIYIGGKHFNARRQAENFDDYVFRKSVEYAKIRNVKIYLTINILISDNEIEQALEFARSSWELGVDAIIVQDIGFATLLRKTYPEIVLHASTQMTVHNLHGVRELEGLGFKRVVLAREMDLAKVKHIANNSRIEIEAFIHGALCVCYSGQCLMSSIIGGRSGNRGMCAQPCRLPYTLEDETKKPYKKGYLMSPKDQCSIEFLEDIIKAGVHSLKIEGRMKNPEYVATVVKNYREHLDKLIEKEKINNEDMDDRLKNLRQSYNRGGFSSGYWMRKLGHDMMSPEKSGHWGIEVGQVIKGQPIQGRVGVALTDAVTVGDGIEIRFPEGKSVSFILSDLKVKAEQRKNAIPGEIVQLGHIEELIPESSIVYKTTSKEHLHEAKETFSGKLYKKVSVWSAIEVEIGQPVKIKVWDDSQNQVTVKSEVICEQAIQRPLTKQRILEQLHKTGNTMFEITDVEMRLDPTATISVGEINRLRRDALEEMERLRTEAIKRVLPRKKIEVISGGCSNNTRISLYMNRWNMELAKVAANADRIYIPLKQILGNMDEFDALTKEKGDAQIFVALPRIMSDSTMEWVKQNLPLVLEGRIDGILCARSSDLDWLKGHNDLLRMADFSVNAYNRYACKFLWEKGFDGVVLSPEMTLKQIEELTCIKGLEKEAIVFGRIPLMISEYCPIGGKAGEKLCNGICKTKRFYLRDRKDKSFPIITDWTECIATILNADRLLLDEPLQRFVNAGVDYLRLNIFDEDVNTVKDAIEFYRKGIQGKIRDLESYPGLVKLKAFGITRGHFYRGVENDN